jgi:hypothetical protein
MLAAPSVEPSAASGGSRGASVTLASPSAEGGGDVPSPASRHAVVPIRVAKTITVRREQRFMGCLLRGLREGRHGLEGDVNTYG